MEEGEANRGSWLVAEDIVEAGNLAELLDKNWRPGEVVALAFVQMLSYI